MGVLSFAIHHFLIGSALFDRIVTGEAVLV